MSTPPDLLELPYAYTQLRMLMHQQFVREAADRGLSLSVDLIEAFHLLTPWFHVRRDGKLIAALQRAGDPRARQVAHWQTTNRLDLEEAHAAGRLADPAEERFMSRACRCAAPGSPDTCWLSVAIMPVR